MSCCMMALALIGNHKLVPEQYYEQESTVRLLLKEK